MSNREIVVGLGRWFARLHKLTQRFAEEHSQLASQARLWSTVHDGVLAEVPIDEQDRRTTSDPKHFGLIHGDVIASNYYWDSTIDMPCIFDWDELQQAWFLYDLSAPIWSVISCERYGSTIDFVDGQF